MNNKEIFSFINKDFQTPESFIVFEYIISLLNNKEEILKENIENNHYWFRIFIRLCNYYIGHQLFHHSHSIKEEQEIEIFNHLTKYLNTDHIVNKNVFDTLFFKLFVADIYIPKIAVHYYYQQEKYSFIPNNFFFLNYNIDNFSKNCTEFLKLNPFLEQNLSKRQLYNKLSIIFNVLFEKKIFSDLILNILVNTFLFDRKNCLLYWKASYNYLVNFYISSSLIPYFIYKNINSEKALSEIFAFFHFEEKSSIYQIDNKVDKEFFLSTIEEKYPNLYLIFKKNYELQRISSNFDNF